MYWIALVVDESFGRRVLELAKEAYVWLVRFRENDRRASALLEARGSRHPPTVRIR
jgi:hypothetical protein